MSAGPGLAEDRFIGPFGVVFAGSFRIFVEREGKRVSFCVVGSYFLARFGDCSALVIKEMYREDLQLYFLAKPLFGIK